MTYNGHQENGSNKDVVEKFLSKSDNGNKQETL